MNNQDQTISIKTYAWIALAWVASLGAAAPVCRSFWFPDPMSPFGLRIITRQLLMLMVPAGIAIFASFKTFRQMRFTPGRFVLWIVPTVLSVAELALAYLFARDV